MWQKIRPTKQGYYWVSLSPRKAYKRLLWFSPKSGGLSLSPNSPVSYCSAGVVEWWFSNRVEVPKNP